MLFLFFLQHISKAAPLYNQTTIYILLRIE